MQVSPGRLGAADRGSELAIVVPSRSSRWPLRSGSSARRSRALALDARHLSALNGSSARASRTASRIASRSAAKLRPVRHDSSSASSGDSGSRSSTIRARRHLIWRHGLPDRIRCTQASKRDGRAGDRYPKNFDRNVLGESEASFLEPSVAARVRSGPNVAQRVISASVALRSPPPMPVRTSSSKGKLQLDLLRRFSSISLCMCALPLAFLHFVVLLVVGATAESKSAGDRAETVVQTRRVLCTQWLSSRAHR